MKCTICGSDRPGLFTVQEKWVCTKCFRKRCNKTLTIENISVKGKGSIPKNHYGIRIVKIL